MGSEGAGGDGDDSMYTTSLDTVQPSGRVR